MKCDFCSSQPVCWRYHVLPIPIVAETPVGISASSDDWLACAVCKVLVDAGKREQLLNRTIATYPGEIRAVADVRATVRHFHGQFFDLLDGPGEAFDEPDDD